MSKPEIYGGKINQGRPPQEICSGASIGLQLKSPGGEKIKLAIRLGLNSSNNESKYKALLAGIELAAIVSVGKFLIRSDSQLVVRQVN